MRPTNEGDVSESAKDDRFLPQGGDDTDSCKKDGVYYEGVYGDCEVGLP